MNLDFNAEKDSAILRVAKSICEHVNLVKDFDLAQTFAASAPPSGADNIPLQRPWHALQDTHHHLWPLPSRQQPSLLVLAIKTVCR